MFNARVLREATREPSFAYVESKVPRQCAETVLAPATFLSVARLMCHDHEGVPSWEK